MKLLSAALVASIALATAGELHADSIRLKNGTVIEGKILAETADNVTIEFGGTVKEFKVISRTNIAAIDKETPDEAAFAELQKLVPTDDLLDAAGYDALLSNDLRIFEIRFKDSKHVAGAKAIIATLEGEKAKVEAGGIKIDGRWITGEEAAKDPYNHNARIAAARMKKAAAAFDYFGALAHFDTLDKDHFYSLHYGGTLTLAKQILPKYDAVLQRLQRENGAIMTERETNLKSMDADLRVKTENAFEVQMATFNAAREASRAKGRTWLAISKWNAASLAEARETITAETERLGALDLGKQRQAAAIVAEIYKSLAMKDLSRAATHAALAKTSGAGGPTIDALIERIESDVKAAEAARIAAAEAEKAKILAALAAAPAVPENGEETPKEENGEKPKAGTKTEDTPKTADSSRGSDDDEDDDESAIVANAGGGMSFTTILLIVAAVMVVVTIVAKVFVSPAAEDE